MARKPYRPEETIQKLREAEVELSQGCTTAAACKKLDVTEQTYYRWREEYGGMKVAQAKRLKELLAEAELDKAILKEAASGNF